MDNPRNDMPSEASEDGIVQGGTDMTEQPSATRGPEKLDIISSPAAEPAAKPAKKRTRSRRKRRNTRNIVSTVLIVVGLALLGTALGLYLKAQWAYHKQSQINEELAAYATVYDEQVTDEEGEPESRAPEVDWAGLKAINDEVVAWLQIPGTNINYPVYQASDNDRYLRNSATGEYAVGGQLFNDYECTRPGLVDQLTLTYGHHMLDGSMFLAVAEMDQQEAFDAVDTVWYVTEKQAYECEPLLLYYTQAEDMKARTFTFKNDEEFHKYLNERLDRAVTKREDAAEIIKTTKHVLCLITCNYYDGYGRTILVCVPKDEAALAKTGA